MATAASIPFSQIAEVPADSCFFGFGLTTPDYPVSLITWEWNDELIFCLRLDPQLGDDTTTRGKYLEKLINKLSIDLELRETSVADGRKIYHKTS